MSENFRIEGALPFDKTKVAIAPIPKTGEAIIDELKKHDLKDALVVLRQINKIAWGSWDGTRIKLTDGETVDPALIQEIRAFTEKAELRLVAAGSKLRGRFVADDEDKEKQYEHIDTVCRFWGEITHSDKDTITVTDKDRKLTQTLPAVEISPDTRYLCLVLRNYIGYDKTTSQAGYADYRYLKITGGEK